MIREMGELTPAELWSPKVRYGYSVNSSNTLLQPDIEIHHLLLYTGRKVWVENLASSPYEVMERTD